MQYIVGVFVVALIGSFCFTALSGKLHIDATRIYAKKRQLKSLFYYNTKEGALHLDLKTAYIGSLYSIIVVSIFIIRYENRPALLFIVMLIGYLAGVWLWYLGKVLKTKKSR